MFNDDTIMNESDDVGPQAIRDGAALAVWAVTMTMLVGAMMVAGVALTAIRLGVTRRF